MNPAQYQPDNSRVVLFSNKNRTVLLNTILSNINQGDVGEKENIRLQKTLDYYMNEVFRVRGNRSTLPVLNREIITVCIKDLKNFIEKNKQNTVLFRETGASYEIMQGERIQMDKKSPIPIPTLPPIPSSNIEDSELSSVELYQLAKQSRENQLQSQLPVLPDRREFYKITDDTTLTSTKQTINGYLTEPIRNLQQEIIIPQESTVNYKEIENNLFLYSADRNWLQTRTTFENRYSFSVLFNTANNGQGFAATPVSQERFKNITNIELVKVILPVEALDVLLEKNVDSSGTFITSYNRNILSYPYISVNIQELESNNFGTNNTIDKCFGVLQYDACWFPDSQTVSDFPKAKTQVARGYVAMIPKFLKCQKKYSPTPLATLQRMSINLLRPDGQPLSKIQDTVDIRTIFSGFMFESTSSVFANGSSSCPEYFFINTVPFFSRFSFSVGDTIAIGGFNYDPKCLTPGSEPFVPGLNDFTNWINCPEGHVVVAIGHDTSGNFDCNNPSSYSNTVGTYISDGPNPIGYANYIIIQARYKDPGTGSLDIQPFVFPGPDDITTVLQNPNTIKCLKSPRRLINTSRQTQFVFRIVTREMDSVSQIRPDNS